MPKKNTKKSTPSKEKSKKEIEVFSPTSNITLSLKDFFEIMHSYIISPEFALFLDVKTIISLSRVCRNFHNIFTSEYLKMVIKLGNLNENLKIQFFVHFAPWIEYFYIM